MSISASSTYPSMNKFIVIVSIFSFLSLLGCGSQSSDIPSVTSVKNPLPPCPDSPNCVRITKEIRHPVDSVFTASKLALRLMQPKEIVLQRSQHKIETVFQVFLFLDDMVLKAEKNDSTSTYLHIRSASRVGHSDLGVNTRRVKQFLEKLDNQFF